MDTEVSVANLRMIGPDGEEEDNVTLWFRDQDGHGIHLFVTDDGAAAYSTERSIAQRAIADRAPYATGTYLTPADVSLLIKDFPHGW